MVDRILGTGYSCLEGADATGEEWLSATFGKFISEIYRGERKPYRWQLRLLTSLAQTGKWPERLSAPTGSGKTTVIEIHIFLNGLAGLGLVEARVPRRLFLTVDRRALVDDQYEHAKSMAMAMETIAHESHDGVVAAIWNGLLLRSGVDAGADESCNRLGVMSMRGGDQDEPIRNDWRRYPTTAMVICATPDMFGSRLMFRGYGVSKNAHALEAGLFAYDSIVVIDEAHLNRQLELTARQIPRLEALSRDSLEVLPLQTMAATATPAGDTPAETAISVTDDDLEVDDTLRQRLCRPKPFEMVMLEDNFNQGSIRQIVECCSQLYEQVGGTVGCIVNTVPNAVRIADALEKEFGSRQVVCVVGRMRSLDRLRAMERLNNSDARFIVGTQALEVGLDIDLGALVTQLASSAAIAQRAGRVNRFAKRSNGPIVVLIPPDLEKSCAPYQNTELEEALAWLEKIGREGPEGLTPWRVSSKEGRPPQSALKREVLERIEWSDADYMSNTSEDLAPEAPYLSGHTANLDLWLRDEFSDDAEVYFVVRAMGDCLHAKSGVQAPYDDGFIMRLLGLVPPLSAEMFPTSMRNAILALRYYFQKEVDDGGDDHRVFLVRRDEPIQVIRSGAPTIRHGDVLVIDETAQLFLREVVREKGPATKDDVYADISENPDLYPTGAPIVMNIPRHSSDEARLGTVLRQMDTIADSFTLADDDEAMISPDDLFIQWVEGVDPASKPAWKAGLSVARVKTVVSNDQLSGTLDCLMKGESSLDGYCLIYTPAHNMQIGWWQEAAAAGSDPIKLESHLQDVAGRAQSIGEQLVLSSEIIDALTKAGLFHDEGKRDKRFQGLLRLGDRKAQHIQEDLAKGRFTSRIKALEYRASCGLRGWRHEQRSAAVAWAALEESNQRELVTRLVGTSHGRGRALFDDRATRLLPDEESNSKLMEAAVGLFDKGTWEWVVNKTNRIYGIWGIAYLEALLRAADMQISSEGR